MKQLILSPLFQRTWKFAADSNRMTARNMHLDSVHQELFGYWRIRSGRSAMPARSDFRPEDIPGILKHIGLIDVACLGQAMRFRYRLVGTRMNFIFGRDFTNTWLHQSKFGAYRDFLHDLYAETAQQGRPVYSATTFAYTDDRSLSVKRLMLPMSSDGEKVNMLLFANTFASDDAEFGVRPYLPEEICEFAEVECAAA